MDQGIDQGMEEVLGLIRDQISYKHPLVLVEEVEKLIMCQPIIVPTAEEYKKFFSTNIKALKILEVTREHQMLTSKPSYLDNLLRATLNNAIESASLEVGNVRLIPVSSETYLGMVPMIRAAHQHAKSPASQPHLAGIQDDSRELFDEIIAIEEDLAAKKHKERLDKDVPPLYDENGNFIDKNFYNRYHHQR